MSTRGIIFYCFSKTQLVGQKYRNKTEAKLKLANEICFGFESQCFLPLVVSMFSSNPPQTPFQVTKSTLKIQCWRSLSRFIVRTRATIEPQHNYNLLLSIVRYNLVTVICLFTSKPMNKNSSMNLQILQATYSWFYIKSHIRKKKNKQTKKLTQTGSL